MAEALVRKRFGDSVGASSAGIRPQKPEDAQAAIETLRLEFKIDASGHVPRDVRTIDLQGFDWVIAIDDVRGGEVARELRKLTGREVIEWKIDDPWRGDPHLYSRCANQVNREVGGLLKPK
jgi:protein-tyrosine-phosphatase